MKRGSRHLNILVKTAAAFILVFIETGQANGVTVDRIVAIVNNEVITLSELKEAVVEAKVPQPGPHLQQETLKKMIGNARSFIRPKHNINKY